MKIITPEQFCQLKTSDTLVVLGSGISVNKVSDEQWKKIGKMNSIGFNWFCHHRFAPTFYVIREQANNRIRDVETETRAHLYKEMSKKSYRNTCLILHDVSAHSPRAYSYVKTHKKFAQNSIIVRDLKKRKVNKKFFTFDIFGKGVFHGKTTLSNVMHIGLYLKYKKFIFVGVDLRHSKYFWLGPKRTRANIRRVGGKSKGRHPAAAHTMNLIKMIKKNFDVEMITANRKSYLAKIMPYQEL